MDNGSLGPTTVSQDFPSLVSLASLVTSTLDTIKDGVKRLSKGGVSRDHDVLESLPVQLPMLQILQYLEATQQEISDYYNSDGSGERRPDALGLRDRQIIVQAIDLLVVFELYPRLAPGVGVPIGKRIQSEAASQVLQALQQPSLLSANQGGRMWAPAKDTDLEQIVLRLTAIVAKRQRGDVAAVLTEKYVPDLLPALLQLAFAPLPPTHDTIGKPVFLIGSQYMVVANQQRRIELRKRFTRLFDSTSSYVLLESLTSLLNASLGVAGAKWFRTLCGRFLSRVLMRPNGARVTIDFVAGNDDSLNAEKLERIANLLLTPPALMDRSEYYAKVVPQISSMAVPVEADTNQNNDNDAVDDERKMVDYIMDKAASQERLTQAAIYALQRLADRDIDVFVRHIADPMLLPLKRWLDERRIHDDGSGDRNSDTTDPIIRGLDALKPRIIEEIRSPVVVSSAYELQRTVGGLQQLVLAYGEPSPGMLEKLVVPVFVPLVHWYAYETDDAQEQIKIATADDNSRPSVKKILAEIAISTLAAMPHSASVAMVVELIQHARGSSSDDQKMDWPVYARIPPGATKLVWHSSIDSQAAEPDEEEQLHVPVDALLEILADSRLSGLVGGLFVTLLREQEALMELARSATAEPQSSNGIRGLAHKWWLVSQTTMAIIERFGPSVLSHHSDILAFILSVLDRYMGDATMGDATMGDATMGDGDESADSKGLDGLESLIESLEVDNAETESKVGGTEIVMLALMLLGQLMSAGEEKAFAGETGLFDAQSLKLLRTIHGQVKQIGRDKRVVKAVAQIAGAVQMQVTLVLALQGQDVSEAGDNVQPNQLLDTELARFNGALRDVRDDLVPVQAHGIIELRNMVLAKSATVLESAERLDATIGVFVDMVKSADSFVYLNAVRGLSALADVHGRRFIPRLIEMYAGAAEFSLDEQLRVGEALLQSIQRAGEMLPEYAPLLVPRLLAVVQSTHKDDPETMVRAHSALSILATAAQTSALALIRWMDLIAATVDGIILLAEPGAVELRRAAVVFWVSLLRGLGSSSRLAEVVDMDILRQMHRTLRRVSHSDDEDELVQMHAQVGVEELDDVVKSQLLFLP